MSKKKRTRNERSRGVSKARQIIYFVLGLIEAILGFRFIFKLLGANPGSSFVAFIYDISDIFVAPFFNIFRTVVSEGIEVVSVFEPATLVAMLVYAFITWGIVRMMDILTGNGNND